MEHLGKDVFEQLNIAITGASGYLGSKLFHRLTYIGHNVLHLKNHQNHGVNMRQFNSTKKELAVFKPDIIVHSAGSYGRNSESAVQLLDANHRFGLQIIEHILKYSSKKVDFVNLGTALPRNLNHYSMTKASFRDHGIMISETNPKLLNFVTLNLQHFYGPGCQSDNFIQKIIDDCLHHRKDIKLTMGYQKRDFIYIEDVVSAIQVIIYNRDKINPQEIIDVGSAKAVTIREAVELIRKIIRSNATFNFGALPVRSREPDTCVADVSRLRDFGWEPKFSLEKGIQKTICLQLKNTRLITPYS